MQSGGARGLELRTAALHGSRKLNYPILDGVIQLQLTCMKVACLMCEIVDTGNQQSNKEIDWKKVFYVF